MKRIGICVLVLALGSAAAQAQARPQVKKAKATDKTATAASGRLEQSSAQAAFAPAASEQFTIADPFVTLYNGRASGSIPLNEPVRAIPNIPKLRYGLAHGHLLFYNTTATSHGGNTGTGSVGTGSTTGNMGTNGVAQGVNGKNPYAGPGIYGNRVRFSGQPVNLPAQESKKDGDQNP